MRAAATPVHLGDGGHSSRSTINSIGQERTDGEKESSGTRQLLDRLGYGLASLSASPGPGEDGKRNGLGNTAHDNDEPTKEPYSASASSMDPAVAETRFLSSQQHNARPPSTAANLASLSRIRALVSNTDRRVEKRDDEGLYSGGSGSRLRKGDARRRSSTPDAATVFRGIRVLLEHNTCGLPGVEEVAIECLSVLKESVGWLSRTIMKGVGQEMHQKDGGYNVANNARRTSTTPVPQLHGPNHGAHAARACIASTVPSVIDCFSRRNLRGPAEDVLAECAARKQLPDASSILVDELVHHGMEHDETSTRLWSTLVSSRLLGRGLLLEKREYGSLLKGLVGRVRDVDDGVVDAAVNALGQMYRAGPETFQKGEACLDPVHRQLLQHYGARIHVQSKKGDGGSSNRDENAVHENDERSALEDSCSNVSGGRGGTVNEQQAEREAVVVMAANRERARDLEKETSVEVEAVEHGWLSSPAGSEQGDERERVQSSVVASSKSSSSGDTSESSGTVEETEEEEDDDDDDSSAASTSSSSRDICSSGSSGSSGSEDAEDDDEDDEDRPKFEPIVDGVTISASTAGPGDNRGARDTESASGGGVSGDGGGGMDVAVSVDAAPTAAAATLVGEAKGETYTISSSSSSRKSGTAFDDAKETRNLVLESSSSSRSSTTKSPGNPDRYGSCSIGAGQHRHRQEEHQQAPRCGASSPPRPVLAGPAATEVPAKIGDERGVGFCPATARKRLVAARKARGGDERGSDQPVSDLGARAGATSLSTATSNEAPADAKAIIKSSRTTVLAEKAKQASAEEELKPATTASKTNAAVSPSRRRKSPPRGTSTPTSTAAAARHQPPERSISDDDDAAPPPLPPLALGELLCTLAEVDAAAGGGGSGKGARDGTGSRSLITKPPGGSGGGSAVDWPASGTAGARRQGRVKAMEDAKRLASETVVSARVDGGERQGHRASLSPGSADSVDTSSSSHVGEIIAVVLRLTDDADFKIALLALQTMQGLVATTGGKHVQPHLALVLQALIPRLGDHKVAARHHAMVVLCTLVRVVGLPSAAPLLVQHGLRSTAWRAKEGALRLVIAGLLFWRPSSSAALETGAEEAGKNRIKSSISSDRRPAAPARGCSGVGGRERWGAVVPTAMDAEEILRGVGSLLNDERPEVRFASVEALAVAADVWSEEGVDVADVLEHAELLSSNESWRRVTARLQDPPSSLSRLGPDDTVELGSGLAPWRTSPDRATAGRRRTMPEQEVSRTPGRDEEDDESELRSKNCTDSDDGGGSCSGGGGGRGGVRGGTSTLRCWRNNEAGDREEVDPWEHHHHGGRQGPGEPYGTSGGNKREDHHGQGLTRSGVDRRSNKGGGDDAGGGGSGGGGPPDRRAAADNNDGGGGGYPAQDNRRSAIQGASDSKRSIASALASSPYNEGGSGGGGRKGTTGGSGGGAATPRRHASSPNLSSTTSRKGGGGGGGGGEGRSGGGRGEGGGGESNANTYTPSWAERSGRGGGGRHNSSATGTSSRAHHPKRRPSGWEDPSPRSPGTVCARRVPPRSSREDRLWGPRDDSEDEPGLDGPWDSIDGRRRRGPADVERGGATGEAEEEGGPWEGGGESRKSGEKDASSYRQAVPDPGLLSTLKRGGCRNAKASRRAVSATAGGGTAPLSGAGADDQSSGGGRGPASFAYDGGGGGRSRSRPRGGAPAEPTTPVPVGRYDGMGRRSHMETTAQQPLPLSLNKRNGGGAEGGGRRGDGRGRGGETFVTGIDTDSQDGSGGGQGESSPVASTRNAPGGAGHRQGFHAQAGVSSATERRRERREAGGGALEQRAGEDDGGGSEASYHHRKDEPGGGGAAAAAGSHRRGGGRRSFSGEGGGGGGAKGSGSGSGISGLGSRRQRGGMSPPPGGLGRAGGGATVFPPSPSSALNKPDSFDYLTAEDIRPSPNPSQELQRTMASLPRDTWPEIFHTLNSVRRLAMHHAPLLGSQSHLHALVRDVLAQSENLRSQVAKNALLALADLWRGLGDTLDPELPMVCPGLVKKLADKVEFLAEAARECVDEVVATATESRALSAFLACGSHRSPAMRAKAAMAVLLCVRRRSYSADPDPSSSSRGGGSSRRRGRGEKANGRGGGGGRTGGGGGGGGGGVGAREMDRLLSALPRFLQDGNQETRHHAKAIVAVLLDTGEVDEARLRREIPPPILERLQRELSNSALPSGLGFTATPNASTPSSSSSIYGSRRRHHSSSTVTTNSGVINRRLGATGPAFSSNSGLTSSPGGSNSSTASGGGRGVRRRRPGGSGGGGGGGGRGAERWAVAGGESWMGGDERERDVQGRGARRVRSGSRGDDGFDDDGGGVADELGPGLLSSPPHRAPPRLSRSRRWGDEGGSGVDLFSDTEGRYHHPDRRPAGASGDDRGPHAAQHKRQGLPAAARAVSKASPRRGSGGGSGSAKRRSNKVFHCREAELLSAVYARLDARDWRERLKGLEEATALLEEHGSGLHAAGKTARLLDRMAELLSDGNLKVNLLALEGVVRLGSSLGDKLESVVNTLVPAVCKNLASSNQQRIALAEEALDALCEAIDPCLFVQPVASLAQYGNARLKVPMLALLRDITPEVGESKPVLLTKYVRPAALSLVRENHPNVRDAGLSLLREVEIALHPSSSRGSRRSGAARSDGQSGRGEQDGTEYERGIGASGGGNLEGGNRMRNERGRGRSSGIDMGRRDRQQQSQQPYPRPVYSATTASGGDDYNHRGSSNRG